MKKSIWILILLTTGLFCSGQSSKSTTDSVYIRIQDSTENAQNQKPSTRYNERNVNTKYEYTESDGARLIIHNSFPKSGVIYIDPTGKKYFYAVFWTRLINETANPLDLTIDFPLDSSELSFASDNYLRLLLPKDVMTIDKEPLYDYGMEIKSFLDKNRFNSHSLKKTILSKESTSFYVVTLTNSGVNGTIRAGLSLKEQTLFYRVNDLEIRCGKINTNKLILQK